MSVQIEALGIDAGSTTTKIVGVDVAGEVVWHQLDETAPQVQPQMEAFVAAAHEAAGHDGIPMVATGYGRGLTSGRKVTEITCHARGVFRVTGHGGTLIDIGGQDSKVIVLGADGKVLDFAMNDKCAAGTGRFLEVSARRLKFSLEEFSNTALAATAEVPISSTCTVFAESEIVSLIAGGGDVGQIVRGLHRSLLKRVAALVHRASFSPPLMLSGGVARSEAIRSLLSEELGHDVIVPARPQLMGAYGAALLALEA